MAFLVKKPKTPHDTIHSKGGGRMKGTIYKSVSQIELHLSEGLNIGELASQAYFSKRHYQRLFEDVMGEPVMEYIKKRRLAQAAVALCETKASVIEIALEYGYSSHEGFTRAFRAHYGMPPLRYRKRYAKKIFQKHEEVSKMMTSEARKKIRTHLNEITKEMEAYTGKLDKLTAAAQPVISQIGKPAGGMKVAFGEWSNLSGRINAAKFEAQKIPDEIHDVYDLYDKADLMMKVHGDIIFQTNLLRILTEVEWIRMGKNKTAFDTIMSEMSAACKEEIVREQAAVKLIQEISTQVHEEVKSEAEQCINQALNILRETVSEGNSLTEKLNKLMIHFGEQGRGFALIAKETAKATDVARAMESTFAKMTEDIKKGKAVTPLTPANKPFMHLQDAAFCTNLTAFNAAVEKARAGDPSECDEPVQGVFEYAGQMQRAAHSCEGLYNDCKRLLELQTGKEEYAANILKLSDVMFIISIMNPQMRLESERAGREDFLALCSDFEKAINECRNQKAITLQERFTPLIKHGKKLAAEAADQGAVLAYFMEEYNKFLSSLDV